MRAQSGAGWTLINGDCVAVLRKFSDARFDSIVTDPPYELGFMSKDWDKSARFPVATDLGMWLAGLIDGEGNFDIHRQKRESGEYFYCRFEISLRADDGAILHMLKDRFGGKVYDCQAPANGSGSPKKRWEMVSRAECASLVALLDRYPLQSKKRRDFLIWREALAESMKTPGVNRPAAMLPYWESLRGLREYGGAISDPSTFIRASNEFTGIAFSVELWREVLRVLKPGGHLLAFGGSRTHHRIAVAIEDAGFEIRDCLTWLFGTGFPKSLNVSKELDRIAGAEREVIGKHPKPAGNKAGGNSLNMSAVGMPAEAFITAPATEAAKQWDGWGTALKPAAEYITLARKPLDNCTVAANVLKWGTGGLNVDGTRIATTDNLGGGAYAKDSSKSAADASSFAMGVTGKEFTQPEGRWPANVLLDEAAAAELDAQSGERTSGKMKAGTKRGTRQGVALGTMPEETAHDTHGDSGGASRFFRVIAGDVVPFAYIAKPSRKERDLGCDALPARTGGEATDREDGSAGVDNPRAGAGRTGGAKNHHPTVKPIELMRYLCRLVTPPGGIVLDPFLGSGTTGIAALREGFQFVGTELSEEYFPIAVARVSAAQIPEPSEPPQCK